MAVLAAMETGNAQRASTILLEVEDIDFVADMHQEVREAYGVEL